MSYIANQHGLFVFPLSILSWELASSTSFWTCSLSGSIQVATHSSIAGGYIRGSKLSLKNRSTFPSSTNNLDKEGKGETFQISVRFAVKICILNLHYNTYWVRGGIKVSICIGFPKFLLICQGFNQVLILQNFFKTLND